MRVVIQENYEKMCKWAADYIVAKINGHKEDRPFVLGLPTGSSPLGVYAELIRQNQAGKVTFKKLSGNKKITVSKAGKVTVKKGLKKGKTYTVKVKVTSAKTKKYAAISKTVKLKVKITK